MEAFGQERSIEFDCSIIGAGPYAEPLKRFATSLNFVQVTFHGDLSLSDVERFIDQETDIVAAMGTSALEGAAREVPTILLDLSYKEVPCNYRFRWLYQATGFNLAEEVSAKHLASEPGSFGRLLASYIEDPLEVGRLCAAYVRDCHSLDRVSRNLIKCLYQSNLQAKHVEDLIGGTERGLGRFLYSFFVEFRTRVRGA
jgi:hypothetical protein